MINILTLIRKDKFEALKIPKIILKVFKVKNMKKLK